MVEFLALAVTVLALGMASILSLRFKVPPLIVFLAIGMVAGTYGLVQQSPTMTFLGDLGSAMLLFAIGTEFSIYKLFDKGILREVKIAVVEIAVSMLLLFIAFSFAFKGPTALLLALVFSITSTGISIKLLESLNLKRQFDIRMIVKISVIEDLITVLAFSLVSSISLSPGQPISGLFIAFFTSIFMFVVAYFLFSQFLDKFIFRFDINEEDILMLALGVLLLFVSLASVLGLSTAFGAYISGSVVSMWKKRWRSLENDLSKFSYIFISFFFFSVGLKADVSGVSFLMLAVMLPVILIAKFSGVFVAVYDALGRTREPFFTSIGMLSRGELSLVIVSAAIGAGLLPASFLGLTALLVLLTVVISFVLMSRATDVYGLIRSRFPKASF